MRATPVSLFAASLFVATALVSAAEPDRTLLSEAAVQTVFFSPDGKTLTAASRDKHIRTWDVASGKVIRDKSLEFGGTLLSSDLVLESLDKDQKSVRVWDLTAERRLRMINGSAIDNVTISPDRKLLAISSEKKRNVSLTNLDTGTETHVLADGLGGAAAIVFSPDGESLVSTNYDNDVRIWKTRSGELVRKVEDLTGAMFAAEFTPDGKQLVMAGLDETVYLLDAKTWALNRKLQGHGETIIAMAISPDGRTLVTGGFDVIGEANPVKVVFWDLATGAIKRTVRSPHCVAALDFSPDGKWLAMSSIGGKEIALFGVN